MLDDIFREENPNGDDSKEEYIVDKGPKYYTIKHTVTTEV